MTPTPKLRWTPHPVLALPTREHFLAAIGETDESARANGEAFVAAADAVSASVSRLYAGVEVPKSDFTVKALWGSRRTHPGTARRRSARVQQGLAAARDLRTFYSPRSARSPIAAPS